MNYTYEQFISELPEDLRSDWQSLEHLERTTYEAVRPDDIVPMFCFQNPISFRRTSSGAHYVVTPDRKVTRIPYAGSYVISWKAKSSQCPIQFR